jgi:hypothetical protein
MTACIDPSQGHYPLKRADPAVRLEDYKTALRYWLNLPDPRIDKILFLENSNYPLDSLKAIAERENPHAKQVEFIGMDCNWYPPKGHYGYAELRMLDLGLQQSRLRDTTSHMIKVSGRFTFPNLGKLLNLLPPEFDAVVDTRVWRTLRKKHNHPNITTQLAIFSHDFYHQYLQDSHQDLLDGKDTHIEGILYTRMARQAVTHKIIFRFPCNVSPIGFPAHRPKPYNHPTQTLSNALRAMARRVLPNWWI